MTDSDMRLDADAATSLVRRYVNPKLTVRQVRPLHGGMINRVVELITDGEPASIVAKLNDADKATVFRKEMQVLEWYRANTYLPVPEPIACFNGESGLKVSGLLMQKINGVNLADAQLSPRGRKVVQRDLARHIAGLHQNRRQSFGSALDPVGVPRWIDCFRPTIEREFESVRNQLSTRTRSVIMDMLAHLDAWLPEEATPTLVHGDLWATNILVDDRHPDRPQVLAFIDCGASYCDPEYELAYLRIFRTATDDFFEEYGRYHAIRTGFDRRCRVYWLNTIMLHVRLFGDEYLARCEDLAQQIRQLA